MPRSIALRGKSDFEELQSRWEAVADAKGYRCQVCSQRIPYGEQDVFFDTGLCGYCDHVAKKDD